MKKSLPETAHSSSALPAECKLLIELRRVRRISFILNAYPLVLVYLPTSAEDNFYIDPNLPQVISRFTSLIEAYQAK